MFRVRILQVLFVIGMDEGSVPLAPAPCEPASEVAALPMKGWVRREPLDAANKHELMRMSI
jgi:hypothetical protein